MTNTISPDQKKLATSNRPLELGPSNKTGGFWTGTGYPIAMMITAIFLLIAALIMSSMY